MSVSIKLQIQCSADDVPYSCDDTAVSCAYANDLDGLVFVDREVSEFEWTFRGGVFWVVWGWSLVGHIS